MAALAPYSAYTRGTSSEIERRISKRRNQEEIMRQRWENHWKYLQRQNVQSLKRAAWSVSRPSSAWAAQNADSCRREREQEERRQKLEERRRKLRQLIHEEQLYYEQELKESTPDKMSLMKTRAEQLKNSRLKRQKALAEEKSVENWRANCPELRQAEVRQREKEMPSNWQQQITHRTAQEELLKREDDRHAQLDKREREKALRAEEAQKRNQQSEEKAHAEALKRQMQEIKAREEEAARLEIEQAKIEQEQSELLIAEERRLKLDEVAKKAELGRMLRQQAKAQLRRKSQRVQQALELDLKILEDITQKEILEHGLETERRERARADATWMKQVVADQLRLEREREAVLDILHKEEAARMWEQRESEWKREKEARQRLMNEVMAERQEQLMAKMESLQIHKAESIQQREVLLREMEEANKQTAREVRSRREGKTTCAEELRAQVEEKRRRAERMRGEYERELAEQRRVEEEYAALVKREEQKILANSPQPKSYGRRKQAWY